MWVRMGVCIELASDDAEKGGHVLPKKKKIALNFSHVIECAFEIENQKIEVSVF